MERAKGHSKVFFVCGTALLDLLGGLAGREAALVGRLSAGPSDLLGRVDDLGARARHAEKQSAALTAEVVALVAASLAAGAQEGGYGVSAAAPRVLACHRTLGSSGGGGGDFAKGLASALDPALAAGKGRVLVLTLADGAEPGAGPGSFLVAGPPALVAAAAPAVASSLGGRGGGKGDRFQGKAPDLAKHAEAEAAAEAAIAALLAGS